MTDKKKLFISVPMNGRTDENIKKSMDKMHKLMEAILGKELEPIQTNINDEFPKEGNIGVYDLGKSISLLAEADYFIGFGYYIDLLKEYKGCEIEATVADRYGIPCYLISDETMAEEILSDLKED